VDGQAATFLLDTGAQGMLVLPDAVWLLSGSAWAGLLV